MCLHDHLHSCPGTPDSAKWTHRERWRDKFLNLFKEWWCIILGGRSGSQGLILAFQMTGELRTGETWGLDTECEENCLHSLYLWFSLSAFAGKSIYPLISFIYPCPLPWVLVTDRINNLRLNKTKSKIIKISPISVAMIVIFLLIHVPQNQFSLYPFDV